MIRKEEEENKYYIQHYCFVLVHDRVITLITWTVIGTLNICCLAKNYVKRSILFSEICLLGKYVTSACSHLAQRMGTGVQRRRSVTLCISVTATVNCTSI